MFRKFTREEHIRSHSKVRSSEQRGIRAQIVQQYPALEVRAASDGGAPMRPAALRSLEGPTLLDKLALLLRRELCA